MQNISQNTVISNLEKYGQISEYFELSEFRDVPHILPDISTEIFSNELSKLMYAYLTTMHVTAMQSLACRQHMANKVSELILLYCSMMKHPRLLINCTCNMGLIWHFGLPCFRLGLGIGYFAHNILPSRIIIHSKKIITATS
jgi:hypothetical protein